MDLSGIIPTKADKYNKYYDFLVNFLNPDWKLKTDDMVKSHSLLLKTLFEKDFYYLNDLDANRAADGIALRNIYTSYNDDCNVPDGNCSVLEMLIALSDRIEYQIMSDDTYGDRTSLWFWTMLENLGISFIDDDKYNGESRSFIDSKIQKWLDRRFDKNGNGSIWTKIPSKNSDKRDFLSLDYWMQANICLSEAY